MAGTHRKWTQADVDVMKRRHSEYVLRQMQGDSRTVEDLAAELSEELGKPMSRFVISRFRSNGWRAGTPRPKPAAEPQSDLRDEVAELRGRIEALESILRVSLRE